MSVLLLDVSSLVVDKLFSAAVALETSEFKFALIVASLLVRFVISAFKLLVIVASASVRLFFSAARLVANTFSAFVALVTSLFRLVLIESKFANAVADL